ncbi:tetratricopeptide TPR_4 [Micromonospora aurantiaca ATCC 27029]|nr:tetratricopeptide TPR_4 [Micromonospora aurantiaca ATCC 27029]
MAAALVILAVGSTLAGRAGAGWPVWLSTVVIALATALAPEVSKLLETERASRARRRELLEARKAKAEDVLAAERGARAALPTVAQCNPRRLGVHSSISLPDGTSAPTSLPAYVPRDADADIRTLISTGMKQGAFVLVIGRSSSGKTRLLYEAIRATAEDWRLLHPSDATTLKELAQAGISLPQTIVWLDEIQNYMSGENGLDPSTVRKLLGGEGPTIFVGTIWPDRYALYTESPMDYGSHIREREVLRLAEIVEVPDRLSTAERRRAGVVAGVDSRIALALEEKDYGMTQFLAAAPELVRRWTAAPDSYKAALITAAIDAVRLGTPSPVSLDLLRDLAPAYLTSSERAQASPSWFEDSLKYATALLLGATSALMPEGSECLPGEFNAVSVADYLLQYGTNYRRSTLPPKAVWDIYLRNTTNPDALLEMAHSAKDRTLFATAERFYLAAVAANAPEARIGFAAMLTERGRLDESIALLREALTLGDEYAFGDLAEALERRNAEGDEEEMLKVLYQGVRADDVEPSRLIRELIKRGRLDEAEAVMWGSLDSSELEVFLMLAEFLAERGRNEECLTVLRRGVSQVHSLIENDSEYRSSWYSYYILERLHSSLGDTDAAESALRRGVEACDNSVSIHEDLARFLFSAKRTTEAIELLNDRYAQGCASCGRMLADHYLEAGNPERAKEYLRGVLGKIQYVSSSLARQLEKEGDLAEAERILRNDGRPEERADISLVNFLARQGRFAEAIETCKDVVKSGDYMSYRNLQDLLELHGDRLEFEQIRDHGMEVEYFN